MARAYLSIVGLVGRWGQGVGGRSDMCVLVSQLV